MFAIATLAAIVAPVVLPFAAHEPLPVVSITVNGAVAHVAVDTGAPALALSSQFARSHGLRLVQRGRGIFAGGRSAPAALTEPVMVRAGGVTLPGLRAEVVQGSGPALSRGIDGAIGTGFLMRFRATIDYPHNRLILEPGHPGVAIASAGTVPMHVFRDHFIFVRAAVNGVRMVLLVDSGGAGVGLDLTRGAVVAARITVRKSGVTFMTPAGVVHALAFSANVTVGAMTQRVPGVYVPNGRSYSIFPFHVDGAVSSEFLKHYAVTFDFLQNWMILH